MLKDYISMALGSLKNRKLRSWLTMIGIFIGIMSIVALIGLGEGLKTAIQGQFSNFGPDIISVTTGAGGGPPGTGEITPFRRDTVEKIENLKEVNRAAGRTIAFGKLEYDDELSFTSAVSMPSGDARDLVNYITNAKPKSGRLLEDTDNGKVVLGSSIPDRFDSEIRKGKDVIINGKKFEVIGILESTGSFTIDGTAFLNDEDFDEVFEREKDTYGLVGVQFNDNTYEAKEAKESIEHLLRKERDVDVGEEDFEVSTPESTLDSLNSTLFAVQLFVYIIAGISIVVGGIGIMSTMYTAVIERTKEIGIMKAIGATNDKIFTLFFIESGLLGLVGGIVGVTLGSATALGIAELGKILLGSDLIQAQISLYLIGGALLLSFLLGSIFGTLPALQAAKLRPVDALRKSK